MTKKSTVRKPKAVKEKRVFPRNGGSMTTEQYLAEYYKQNQFTVAFKQESKDE